MKKIMKPGGGLKHRLLFCLIGMFFSLGAYAQDITVNGNVTDEAGTPIIGASIVQQNTTNGTITDLDGNFTLTVPRNGVLVVSYIGYTAQNVAVNGRAALSVILREDNQLLDEVVVIGYGTMKKSDLTGAVSSVKATEITAAPVASIGQALQGRAAGVQIINSGKPGDNVTMKVRGLGTINNSDPLVVIDGVPTDLGLNSLNTMDIENVDVLKDASATAIYGSRGANGVVMITTKRGQAGKGQISFSSNLAIQEATGMPKMLNAAQYAALSNDMLNNTPSSALQPNPDWADPASLGKGTDWMDELISSAPMQNYSLSYSGGTEDNRYYVSGGLFDQQGLVRNTDFRRYTFQFNNDVKPKKWIKFTNNLTFSHDIKKSGSYDIMSTMRALPTQPLKNEDGSWSGPEGKAEWYGDVRNPIGPTELTKNETKGYNVLGNISAEIDIIKGLKFKTLGGVDYKSWYDNNFTPAYPWKPIAVEVSEKYQSSNRSLTLLWDNYFTYNQSFGRHFINAMAGMSAQSNRYDYMNGAKNTFLRDENNQLDNGSIVQSLNGSGNEWALLSYMARVNYTFADRYYLTATVRHDGSSRFGTNNKWGTFPSFSAAWRISEESWFPTNAILNDLKMRVGYGITGNQNIGNYEFAAIYDIGIYNFNDIPVSTLVANKMPNPNIKWEQVEQMNIGFDLSFFDQRLMLNIDGYIKNTNNMLVPMAVPISTGYSDQDVPKINAGEMRNKGVELTLNAQNMKGVVEWFTTVNLTWNQNEIISLNSDSPMYQNSIENSNVTIQAQDRPMNAFYGYVTDGIFQNQDEVDTHSVQIIGGTAPGDIRYRDLNNDGVIDDTDRTFIGDPNPDWIYSMNNRVIWKNFDFEIFLQGTLGNDIYNANRMTMEGMKISENQFATVLDRWTGEGTSNVMPRAVYNDPNKNTRGSDRYIEDGSYLRIKNLSLGYSFPRNLLSKIYIDQLRVYISCQNVATITGYSGVDPEVGLNGIDRGMYPLTRTYSVGLNLSF